MTNGPASAAPPRSVMNSRRLLSNMELPAPWVTASVERPSLHEPTISHPPGVDFSAGAVRVCQIAAPAPKHLRSKNGFQPSFWSRGENSFSESKSPPLGGGRQMGCLQCNRSAWAEPTYVFTPRRRRLRAGRKGWDPEPEKGYSDQVRPAAIALA